MARIQIKSETPHPIVLRAAVGAADERSDEADGEQARHHPAAHAEASAACLWVRAERLD